MRIHPVLLALAAAGLLLAPPTNAVLFNVSSTFDSPDSTPGDGLCHADIGVCTLRAAIQETNALAGADEIVLAAGTYLLTRAGANEDYALTGDLDIRDGLTLSGAGPSRTIIDAGDLDRVLDLVPAAGSTIAIRGVTLSNGTLPPSGAFVESGGGVRIFGAGSFSFDDCRMTGNRATSEQSGYALAVIGADQVSLTRCEIDENRRTSGSPIEGQTLFFWAALPTYWLQDCWLHDNDGTGVFTQLDAVLHVDRSTIEVQGGRGILSSGDLFLVSSTLAWNQDGGLLIGSLAGVTWLVQTTISSNRTNGSGGGILALGGGLSLSSVTLTGNVADGDAAGGGNGGGAWIDASASLRLRHTILGGNSDDSPSGDVFPDCAGTVESERFNLVANASGCTITGDTGGNIGGVGPGLGPLARRGGTTPVHVPLPTSPVLDAGDDDCTDVNGTLLQWDQRGYPREIDGDQEQGAYCDLGAAEHNPPLLFRDGFESGTCWAWAATAGY